ncbi:BTAD domain-containing putative transcriptional regulator [Geodermatophilus sp. SYSU D00691]
MTVEFGVLGGVWAALDGDPVDLGGHRQRSVVARLLVARGAVVPADLLVGDLWHAETPPRAQAALQAHISHLRRSLEPDRPPRAPARLLVTVPPGYALRPDDEAVDALRAARLLAEGDRLAGDDPAAARDRYAAALELWRGPAYAEYAGDPWAAPEAARLDELRLTAVERWAAASLDVPGGPDPLAQLRAHVAEHPLREEGWRLLALGLYRAGRQADALAALREVRGRLADELGVDPGPALRALEDDVLAQAPRLLHPPGVSARAGALHAPRTQSTSTPEDVPGPALLGRDAELTALHAAASAAAGGRLQVAVVTGEAGSGKSALVERLAADLAAAGWTTCPARCPETDGAPSGWPWTEALGRLARTHPPAEPDRLAPLLGDAPEPAAGDAAASRFRLHRAVAGWLADVAVAAPLLVVLDDLHRADQETAALLRDVVAALERARVLVVVATRPEPLPELDAALAALARRSPLRLALGGLDDEAVGRLVDDVTATPVGDAVRAAIAERTGGNPFLVRELARLVSGGADVGAVPSGVRDVVRSRLAALPAQTGSLLRLAAVCGRDVDVDVLLAAAQADEDDDAVVDALESALVSGLLLEPGPGRLRFVHALVRDTLYQDLSSLRATRLHDRVARALEELRPGDVTALAHHSEAAGPARAAATARHAAAAAELAERRFSHRDAAQWWQRAARAAATAHPDDEAGRLRLVARGARAATLAGDLPTGRGLRDAALPEAERLGDPVVTAEVLLACDVPTMWIPRHTAVDDRVVAVAERTIAALPDRPDLRSRLLGVIAFALSGAPDPRGYEASLEAVELARATGDPLLLASALNARYLNTYRYGGLDERGRLGRELLELAQREDLGLFEATARLVLVQHSCGVLDLAAADEHAAEAERLALAFGLPLLRGIATWYRGLRAALAGRYDEAEEAYGTAVGQVGETGFWADQAHALWWISVFCLRVAAGRHDGLAESTRAMYDTAPEDAHEVLAAALALEDRLDEARELAATRYPVGQDFFTPLWLYLRGVLGLAVRDEGRVAEAYAGLLPHEGTVCGAWTATVALGPTATLLARLAAHRGDAAAAARHQRTAAEVARRTGNPDWVTAAEHALDRASSRSSTGA